MLGYSPDELLGTDATVLLNDEVARQIEDLYPDPEEDYIEQPSVESKLRTASGEWLPVEVTPAMLPKDDDSNWHRVGVHRDISDWKERERAIKESERCYRALVENFPDRAVGLFNEGLRYTAVGGQLFESLDFEPGDRTGNSFTELHPPSLVEELKPHFHAALNGETSTFEVE